MERADLGFLSHGPLTAPHVVTAASRLGCTPTQLTLAWQLTRPVTSTIVDAQHLEDALAALHVEIPADVAAELDEAGRA